MKLRLLQKLRHSPLAMIASPLLALSLGGVGWASVCNPGITPFLELEFPANLGFNGSGTVDWANSGANLPNRSCMVATSPAGSIECTGSGGLFDDGIFNGQFVPPTPAMFISTNPTIAAQAFAVDPLSADTAGACSLSATACTATLPCPSPETCVTCTSGDPTAYTAMGSETNGDDLNSDTYSTGSVPPKAEISNVYAIAHQVNFSPGTCTTCPSTNPTCTGTNEIFAGFERVVNNGDSHVDLEFLQAPITLEPGKDASAFPCAGKFSGDRTQGDLVLSVDFSTGGSIGLPSVHRWVCQVPPVPGQDGTACKPTKSGTHECSGSPTTEPCYLLTSFTSNEVRQTINSAGPIGCGGWACRNANGTQTNTINTNEFYEVGIDLSAIGFTGCISTFIPHTRSSTTFTSTLKDFAVVPFNTCHPHIKPTKTCTAAVNTAGTGVNVRFSGQVTNDGNVAVSNIVLSNNRTGTVFDNPCTNATSTAPCCTSSTTLQPQVSGVCPTGKICSCSYSGRYSTTTCTSSDTVTVTASSTAGGVTQTATAEASASCSTAIHPKISVTKCCQNHLVADSTGHLVQQVDFKGQVCAKDASGTPSDVQLTGVTLTDNKGGVTTAPSTTLNPGACSPYSGKYFPTATETNTCSESDTATASASGTAICGGRAGPVSVTATCNLCPPSSPCP